MADAPYDFDQQVQDLVSADRVREAIVHLPENERRAIELAYFGGCTYVKWPGCSGSLKKRSRAGCGRGFVGYGTASKSASSGDEPAARSYLAM